MAPQCRRLAVGHRPERQGRPARLFWRQEQGAPRGALLGGAHPSRRDRAVRHLQGHRHRSCRQIVRPLRHRPLRTEGRQDRAQGQLPQGRLMANDTVLWEIDRRGVATVTLNRPQANNAYNGELIQGLPDPMTPLGREAGLRIVVLRGNGRHFQAGADLAWISGVAKQSPAENEAVSRLTAEAVRRLDTAPVPTLALIQGGCFGGGTGIAAACDVVAASEDAIFSISGTRWGLMAGTILPQLCQAMGLRQVRRYALTGERFGAQEARRLGLVHQVCAAGSRAAGGEKIVEAVLLKGARATTSTNRRALASARAFIDDGELRDLIDEHARARQQDEASEGLASFREKRKPGWYPG